MFALQLAEIFFKAGILCLLLYLMARHEADYSFTKVAMVTAGITLGTLLLEVFLKQYLGWLTLIPMAGFIIWMLIQFCWLSFKKAVLVTIPFLAFCILLAMGVAVLQARANAAIGNAMGIRPYSQEDMKEVMKFYHQSMGTLPSASAASDSGNKPEKKLPATAPPVKTASPSSAPGTNQPAATSVTQMDWHIAQTRLKVSGIMSGKKGNAMAIVNNQRVESGDQVEVEYNHNLYQWQAQSINRDQVVWKPVSVRPAN